MDNVQPVHVYLVKVLAVFMHPVYGDMFTLPWRRSESGRNYVISLFNNLAISEFNESLPLFECLKQMITNSLTELDWIGTLSKIYNTEDENNGNLTKISVLRVNYN
jgi:hypothetical protein